VLVSFQQVEDQLAASRILEQQATVQDRAVAAAREAERLALNQYRAGTVDYTTVITAQATALSNEETAVNLHQTRLVSSVNLVQALGGGWSTQQLPSAGQVESEAGGSIFSPPLPPPPFDKK
jgi:outer membrane protein TolC